MRGPAYQGLAFTVHQLWWFVVHVRYGQRRIAYECRARRRISVTKRGWVLNMRILAVAGSSGGHVFPAVGFLDDFKTAYPGTQTLLVLPLCSINKGFTTGRHPVCFISVQALSMKPSVRNISAALNFIKGFFESIIILARFKPDIVVGFGSIASIPVLVCAGLFRMTVMIHEQNELPGRANRLLAVVRD